MKKENYIGRNRLDTVLLDKCFIIDSIKELTFILSLFEIDDNWVCYSAKKFNPDIIIPALINGTKVFIMAGDE